MKPKDALKTLTRRYNFLIDRIENSDKNLTYDKAEVAALKIALNLLEERKKCKDVSNAFSEKNNSGGKTI